MYNITEGIRIHQNYTEHIRVYTNLNITLLLVNVSTYIGVYLCEYI